MTGVQTCALPIFVKAQHVSILVYLEPVTAVLWAWAVLGERPELATVFGGVAIIAAGLLVVVPGLRAATPVGLPEPVRAGVGGAS